MIHSISTRRGRQWLPHYAALICSLLILAASAPLSAQEAPAIIIAEIANLNTGANLHIRSAPQADSISLGLAPGGTDLELLGMNEGRNWAYIHFADGEGVELRGWVSADYINFRSDGRYYSLSQLENADQIITVADNILGGIIRTGDSTVSAPVSDQTQDDNFYAEVVNLNPGANLHIRRDPNTQAESLALVPNGTALLLSGLHSDNEWVFVRLIQPDGNQVSGWVSADYVSYRYRGRYYSPTQLLASGRIGEISANTRGEYLDASGQPINDVDNTLYTEVAGLEETANLHLRRAPDSSSESLILAPNGASFTLLGFAEDGEWAFVQWPQSDGSSFSGWVSSTFLLFHQRGLFFTIEQLIDADLAEIIEESTIGFYTYPDGTIENLRDDSVYAVVAGLDSGVSLHIRIAPDANSESLRLVPNGTALELVGLNGDKDWAYVRYTEAETGGTVEGWVSSLYLSFRFRGGILSAETLLNLGRIGTVDDDQRGFTAGASSIVSTIDSTVYADIVGLNAGANLHIRIAPDVSSESLMLVPGGTSLALEGLNPSNTWAYIHHEMQSGTVSGWVNTNYLDYHYRGQQYSANQLLGAGYIRTVPDSERGLLSGEVSEPVQDDAVYGTILGASTLAVRRLPDRASESIYEVAGGTKVKVYALNDDLTWSYIILELDNGEIRGWLPGSDIQYTYRNLSYSAKQLYDRRWIGRFVNAVEGSSTLTTSTQPSPATPPAEASADTDTTNNTGAQPGSATIINLPPDGRLAIRNSPQSSAATLSLLAPGTELRLFGFNGDLTWSYLRYTQPDGTTISGWAPMTNLAIAHSASPATNAIFLLGDGLLQLVDDSFPGSVIAGAGHADLFPPAALIEAESANGAALSLRETPSTNAASLGQVAGAARLTALGMNTELGWVYAQSDEASGRNLLGWLPLADLRLYADSELLDASAYDAAQSQHQIPLVTAELRGAASP